jgi:hypothetical protein
LSFGVNLAKKYKANNAFVYPKKYVPEFKKKNPKTIRAQKLEEKKSLYTENWDKIRRAVYKRDGYKCAMCNCGGKLHCHHIIPVRISHDNSLSNLVSLCPKCHKRLEEVGFSILQNSGHKADVRRVEMRMIMEEQKKWKNAKK